MASAYQQSNPYEISDPLSLEERAEALSRDFRQATPTQILDEAIHHIFTGRIALVSSFGAESAALIHLVASINPDVPVIFLDTGKHFAQTLNYRKKLSQRLELTNVLNIHPDTDEENAIDAGGDLWRRDADACCNLRKVRPLRSVLSGYDAWITGRKQFHGGERVHLPVFDVSVPHIKVNPLVCWTSADVTAYLKTHDLPVHPLVAQGYPSIGCWPCTHPVSEGDDVRAGRWRGASKTECGIHESSSKVRSS